MTKAPISLQDLRRRLYIKAKAEPAWRFWGLYVHICKRETLRDAYRMAKANDGAPGIDGVTFQAVEAEGVELFLERLREELIQRTYRPRRARKVEIPKGNGKLRQASALNGCGVFAVRSRTTDPLPRALGRISPGTFVSAAQERPSVPGSS